MALDPNISLGVRGIELQNPLNALAQVSQIQNAQNQNAMAQLQMREAETAAQEKNMLRRLDPTAADYETQLFRVDPKLGIQYRKEQSAADASKAATSASLASAAKSKQELLGQALRDISGRPSDANITAHTEDIQASPLFSTEEKAKAIVTQKTLLSMPFEERQAYLQMQGAKASDLIVKPTLTETSRLLSERAALIKAGVLETDPRIQAYDQKLASGESQSAKLQRELQVAITNKASPAVIAQLQRDIRNLHPGLAMQNVTGVDAQGNQIVTRFAGTGGGPQGQFALNQAPTGTARAMLGLTEADSALLFGPGGPVELGQIPVGKLNASNAKMYVAAIKANPTLNLASLTEDQLLQASKAKAQGNIQGKQVLTLADRATAKNIAEGNIPPLTGPNSTRIMNEVIAMKPDYSARDYNLQTSAVKAFNQGIQGNKVRSLNVVMEHFNTLEKAADALQSGDVRAINAVSQYIQTQTGKPAPGNFNAVKEILADEIVASVVPGVGALADRQAIKKTILASSSPEQLKGIVANYKELIGGQLNGLETQYKAGTGRSDFKARYLTPAAVQGLMPPSASTGGGAGAVDTSNPYLK
tara:strand:+ start:5955 stop:7721 length:1767 start_codon:yes stop_codon:yes gene_type:complete